MRPKVWEEMSKIDFQDDGYGGHLGYFLLAHLAILCLQDALMLIIKFQFNWIIEEMNSQHFSHINVYGLYKCMGKQI